MMALQSIGSPKIFVDITTHSDIRRTIVTKAAKKYVRSQLNFKSKSLLKRLFSQKYQLSQRLRIVLDIEAVRNQVEVFL